MIINVNNTKELYEAVNNPAYAGNTIVLAPETYFLSDNDGNGHNYPNGGRLDLQHNMALLGQVGDRGLVKINVSGLPPASYDLLEAPRVRTGAVRMGNGRNSIEWITFENSNQNIRSIIQTDIQTVLPQQRYEWLIPR